jgi:YidC/Oxa1 family membrane protein insertase
MWDTLILNPMINALLFLYQTLGGNFGIAIIVFTIAIRLVTFPLTYQTQKSAKRMQDLQKSKAWTDLEKKYAKEPQKKQSEQMKLMQASGANPLGGCLPTLVQLPIMIGLYQSIINVIPVSPMQLFGLSQRLYAFFPSTLIPLQKTFLWMNLAVPERVLLPGLSFEISVLAILVAVTSWVSQRMIPMMSTDPSQAQTSLIMNVFMVIVMTNISLSLASGLSVYFVVTNLFTMLQYIATGQANWHQVFSLGTGAPSKKTVSVSAKK